MRLADPSTINPEGVAQKFFNPFNERAYNFKKHPGSRAHRLQHQRQDELLLPLGRRFADGELSQPIRLRRLSHSSQSSAKAWLQLVLEPWSTLRISPTTHQRIHLRFTTTLRRSFRHPSRAQSKAISVRSNRPLASRSRNSIRSPTWITAPRF